MKKLLPVLLVSAMILALGGCGSTATPSATDVSTSNTTEDVSAEEIPSAEEDVSAQVIPSTKEDIPLAYAEEKGLVFSEMEDLNNLSTNYFLAFADEEKNVIEGSPYVTFSTDTTTYQFNAIECSPSEKEGYTDVTVSSAFFVHPSFAIDTLYTTSTGDFCYQMHDPCFADYYTGLQLPHTILTGSDDFAFSTTVEWEGQEYTIENGATSVAEGFWDEWIYDEKSPNMASSTYNYTTTDTYVITIPNGYDGLIFYVPCYDVEPLTTFAEDEDASNAGLHLLEDKDGTERAPEDFFCVRIIPE